MSLYICVAQSLEDDLLNPSIGIYEAESEDAAKRAMATAIYGTIEQRMKPLEDSPSWPGLSDERKAEHRSWVERELTERMVDVLKAIEATTVNGVPIDVFSLSRRI